MAGDEWDIEYWKDSDAWKEDPNTNWALVDRYVELGYLTPEERDLLHAESSITYSDMPLDQFPEVDAAREAWVDAQDEHGDDPEFAEDSSSLPKPKFDDGPVEGNDYGASPDSGEIATAEPPDVPRGGGEGKGGDGAVAVNTQALRTFAENVEALRVMIEDANKETQKVDVKPGGFHLAYKLREKIMGSWAGDGNVTGLKHEVDSYMRHLEIGLRNVSEEVRKLVVDYDNTEDLNKLTTSKLDSIMQETSEFINSGSNPGSSSV